MCASSLRAGEMPPGTGATSIGARGTGGRPSPYRGPASFAPTVIVRRVARPSPALVELVGGARGAGEGGQPGAVGPPAVVQVLAEQRGEAGRVVVEDLLRHVL